MTAANCVLAVLHDVTHSVVVVPGSKPLSYTGVCVLRKSTLSKQPQYFQLVTLGSWISPPESIAVVYFSKTDSGSS